MIVRRKEVFTACQWLGDNKEEFIKVLKIPKEVHGFYGSKIIVSYTFCNIGDWVLRTADDFLVVKDAEFKKQYTKVRKPCKVKE